MTVPAEFLYNATVVSVHDGDTIDMIIDRGMRDYTGNVDHPVPVRLAGCNARELGQVGGPQAQENLAAMLPAGTPVVLHTVKPDKYAPRWDAYVETAIFADLTAQLIVQQWAAAWNGSGPAPVPPWPRTVG